MSDFERLKQEALRVVDASHSRPAVQETRSAHSTPGLVSCPACRKEISAAAAACPSCGHPMLATSGTGAYIPGGTITIEQTAKPLKKKILISILLILGGLILVMTGGATSSGTLGIIGFFMFIGGIGLYIVTKARIWWHHD
jgi:hypothetical protein